MDGSLLSASYATITALVGILALGVSLQGIIGSNKLGWVSRVCAAISAVLFVMPTGLTDLFALGFILVSMMIVLWKKHKNSEESVKTL